MRIIKGHLAESKFTSWAGTTLALLVSIVGVIDTAITLNTGDLPTVSIATATLCCIAALVAFSHKALTGRLILPATILGLTIAIIDIFTAYGFNVWKLLFGPSIANTIAATTPATLTAATASSCVFILFLRRYQFPKSVVSAEILMTGLMIIVVAAGNFMGQATSYLYITAESFDFNFSTANLIFAILGIDLVAGGHRYLRKKHSHTTFKRLLYTSYSLVGFVILLFLIIHGASLQKTSRAIDSVSRIATSVIAEDISSIHKTLFNNLETIKSNELHSHMDHADANGFIEIRTTNPVNPAPLTFLFKSAKHFYTKSISTKDDVYIAIAPNNQFTIALRSLLNNGQYVWLFTVYEAEDVLSFFKAEIPPSLQMKIIQVDADESPLTLPDIEKSFHVRLISTGFGSTLNTIEMSLLVFMLAIVHSIVMAIDSRVRQLSLKEYLTKIFDLMDSGLATIDNQGQILSCNNAFRRIIGIDKGARLDAVQARGLSGPGSEAEFYSTLVDGQQRHYEISKHSTHTDGRPVNIVVLNDKTSDLLIQKALNEKNHELENILSSLSEAVVTVDHTLTVTFANNAARELLSVKHRNDWRRAVTQVLLKEDQVTHRATLEAIETNTPRRLDSHTLALPDGPSVTISLTVAPVTTSNAPTRAVLMFKDATEETKARRAQAEALLTLESMNQDLREFNHLVSHDFKEPSRTVSLLVDAVELSLSQGDIDGATLLLQKIKSAALRLHGYTVSLKEFSEAKQLEVSNVPVDLRGAILHAMSDLHARIEQCNAVIEVDDDLPTVLGNADFIARVFMNLINNAIKYVPAGKTPYVRIWAKSNNQGQASIFIKDNGIGIDKEDFDIIFLPFRRLHSSGEYHGSGVGLAIVERLVKKMFGTISVKSSSHSGTVFELVLHVV